MRGCGCRGLSKEPPARVCRAVFVCALFIVMQIALLSPRHLASACVRACVLPPNHIAECIQHTSQQHKSIEFIAEHRRWGGLGVGVCVQIPVRILCFDDKATRRGDLYEMCAEAMQPGIMMMTLNIAATCERACVRCSPMFASVSRGGWDSGALISAAQTPIYEAMF